MAATFRAMRHRNYRVWSSGAIVSNTGTWMQRVAQDWLVLTVLTDHSAAALGIVTGLQFTPQLVLSMYAGVLVDRFSKRRILLVTQGVSAVLALGLGVLVLTGTVALWHVLAFALALGVVASVDGPARQAFVSEMVPPEDMSNAVSLNAGSFNLGRLLGPAVAGVLIAWLGVGPVFLLNAASFAAVLLSLLRIRRSDLRSSPPVARGGTPIRDGLRHVREHPELRVIVVVAAVLGLFGLNFIVLTALMATTVFHRGPGEFGLLGSMAAVGAVSGALLAARRVEPGLRVVTVSLLGYGICAAVAAFVPAYAAFAVLLVPIGMSTTTMLTTSNAALQLAAAPEMRGRVLALYMAVVQGGTALGSPVVGWIAGVVGAPWAMFVCGAVVLATGLALAGYILLTGVGGPLWRSRARPAVPLHELPTDR